MIRPRIFFSSLTATICIATGIFCFCRFSHANPQDIAIINIDDQPATSWQWQQRRMLARLIKAVADAKPRAIAVTLPCDTYTSVGADVSLINAVKDAGGAYFVMPLWDKLYTYAKGIGNAEYEKEKSAIAISASKKIKGRDYPALSFLLARDFFKASAKQSVSFRLDTSDRIFECTSEDIVSGKGSDFLKDKICFVGRSDANRVQASALAALVYPEVSIAVLPWRAILAVISIILLAAGLVLAGRTHRLVVAFSKHNGLAALPKASGLMSFGVSHYLVKNHRGTIFDARNWPAGRHWIWMGDFAVGAHYSRHAETVKKFFHGLTDGFGPREAMIQLNNRLFKDNGSTFTNLIHVDIDAQSRSVNFSNAGFESPLLYSGATREFRDFPDVSTPLGIKTDILVDEHKLILENSDIFLLFNSGIVKSRNRDGRFIDVDQLKFLVEENRHLSAKQLSDKILKVILDFNHGRPSADMIFAVIKAG